MQLSQNQKTFSKFFFASSKFIFNFENFLKKDDSITWCIFALKDSERGG